MQRSSLTSRIGFSGPIKYSLIVAVVGVIGILAIMLWTAHTVRKHIAIASASVFPAALGSQSAGIAFERMNRDYGNAVVMQDEAALVSADQEAATVVSSLNSVAADLRLNPGRNRQIVYLLDRFGNLRTQSKRCYTAATSASEIAEKQETMAALSEENKTLQQGLKTLQGDLAGDFRNELDLIDGLQRLQAILLVVVLAGVMIALSFSTRSLIDFTVQRREDDLLRQANLAQENERKMLRALIDNVPDHMFVKDTAGRFVLANVHLAQIAGMKTPEEMLGKTDYEVFPQEVARAFHEGDQKVMLAGTALYNHEELAIDDKGNQFHVLTTKVPICDGSGKVIGIAGVGRDITARKIVEDELREAERKYRGIFDNAIIGVFQSTPEGRTLSVNPSMARIYGFDSPEEMIAHNNDIACQAYVDPDRREEFKRQMEEFGGTQNFECENLRKDGSKFWISMSAVAIRENGVVVRYEGMTQDITERNHLREQLLQAQKLESVGQLASGIAHEINTPTQYIGDNIRFLKDAFQDLSNLLGSYQQMFVAAKGDTLSSETIREIAAEVEGAETGYLLEEIPKAIDQALEGVTRVSRLVRAMKEFSHPGTNEKTPLGLNHAIENTITVARNEWKYVSDVETDFDPSLPLISCLPGEFNQVVLNLIVNAAHAIGDVVKNGGPAKGKITVQTRNCPEWAEIRIQDTGTGIPEKVRARIFDPFFTTKEIGKGTGQGLAIARSVIVDKLGGSIHFETEAGKGTTFIIRLPFDGQTLASKAVAA